MKQGQIDLSIVIPASNEEGRIGESLDKIRTYLSRKPISFEVIVVDDGSSDKTLEVSTSRLDGTRHRVLQNGSNRGKGFSVRKGIEAATGEWILLTDADLSTPIEELDKLVRPLEEEGCDIAIASRALPTSSVEVHQSFIREMMGKTFNLFARVLAFQGIRDSQCGFKVFKKEAAKQIFARQRLNGFCFDAEVLYLAQRMGFSIKEVGVRWLNSPKSRVKILVDSVKMLLDLFRIRLLHFGKNR